MRSGSPESPRSRFSRWLIFSLVGVTGVSVQLLALTLLEIGGLNYLMATALAVEAAVLNNFIWHERWTWQDRRSEGRGRAAVRLARFNLTVGSISIAQNLVLMKVLVGHLAFDLLPASLMSITLCALVNFLVSDRLVFRSSDLAPAPGSSKGRIEMRSRRSCLGATETILLVISVGVASPLNAQGLPDGTVRSWNAYVGLTEDRIGGEIHSQGHAFLVQDFQDPESARNDRRDLLAGKVIISEMATRDGNGRQLDVEGGRVHHWRGAILIPGATLEEVLRNVQNPDAAEGQQEDVLETRVLDRGQGWLRVYLKLVRSKIVTVTYNSEHLVHYRLHGTGRASSQTVATKIAELADAGTPAEHEKHQNEDRGFLWRLNTYWRYEEVDQGVLVECESVSLSRSIPLLVRPFVNPIVNGIAKESLHRTLSAMRERMRRPARLE